MIKKDDHLLDILRKRKDEYHIPLREDAWEKLEKELSPFPSRQISYRWVFAVAAVLLLAITFSIPLLLKKEVSEPVHFCFKQGNSITQKKELPVRIAQQYPTVVASLVTATKQKNENITQPIEYIDIENIDKEEDIPIELNTQTEKHLVKEESDINVEEKPSLMGPQQENKTIYYNTVPSPRKQNHKWSWGVSAGSNSTSATSFSSENSKPPVKPPIDPPFTNPGDGENPGIELPEPGEDDEEKDGTPTKSFNNPMSINEPTFTRRKYHHNFPISVGISARKNISNNFALESGLTYTFLHSDISEEGFYGHIGEQKLHYLGIPLKANWLFFNQGRISIYLSGGALFEYCISARQKIHAINKDPDINRFQFSLGAGAGIQIALMKPVSLFVEPGASYYFDPGGEVETIRKEKPFMFNLQAGIRFTY